MEHFLQFPPETEIWTICRSHHWHTLKVRDIWHGLFVRCCFLIEPGNGQFVDQKPLLWFLLLSSLLENSKCKTYWNIEPMNILIQRFREGHIKFTCKGITELLVYSEISLESQISPFYSWKESLSSLPWGKMRYHIERGSHRWTNLQLMEEKISKFERRLWGLLKIYQLSTHLCLHR